MQSRSERATVRHLALAVLLVASLASCSGDAGSAADIGSATASSASSSPDGSPSPPDGSPDGSPGGEARLVGDGYSFALPSGWRDATEQFQEYSELIDAGAINAAQAGQPFSDNVNVLRNADKVELPPAQAEHQFTEELRTVAERVEVQRTVRVDGVGALHLTGRTKAGEVTALTDQYIAYVDGTYFVVTFSYGSATPPSQREEEIALVLDSWAWG